MTLWDKTLSSFRDEVASARPTPGGGSVCAVTASLGLGLVIMALEITRKPANVELIARARALLDQLAESVDADVRAFDGYMQAHKLPRTNDAETRERQSRLQEAARFATEVPLTAAQHVVEALELSARAEVKAHVRSDVVAGAELLHASLQGLFATLGMNLDALDEPTRAWAISTRAQLAIRAATALASVRARSP